MSAPRISYKELPDGQVSARVVGANGEVQFATERYDSRGNADRGLAEIARSIMELVESGVIDLERAT